MSEQTQPEAGPDRVVCPADKDPAVRIFIGAAMLIGFAFWCLAEKHQYAPPEAWTREHINAAAGYVLNHWGPWVFLPVAGVLIVYALLTLRRKIEADDKGISVNGGQPIPWSDFDGIDAALLPKKGILRLKRHNGEYVRLDRYKVKNFKALADLIEHRLGDVPEEAEAGEAT